MSNQMLGLSVCHGASGHISSFDADELSHRQIATGNHCYGYTAGAGKTTTSCVHFIFDTQGEIPYTPTPTKGVLITSPTVIPLTTGRINISLGCYGCRASSDISDDLMFIGIPLAEMPMVVQGLGELSKKVIPDSRAKIYLPF